MFFSSPNALALVYFTSDPSKAHDVLKAGADAILVDCEYLGKHDRQNGFDTEINSNNPEQVESVKNVNPSAYIMCRVNNDFGGTTEGQIERAIKSGADAIVVPMVESVNHIKRANTIINQRARLIVMIESQSGIENFSKIAEEQFSAVYVGLNDLSISRGGSPLFEPLYNGMIAHIIKHSKVPVGVGGVTEPSMGHPIRSKDIIQQYAKLGVSFSVLRRSFEQAVLEMPAEVVISNIKSTYSMYRNGVSDNNIDKG